MKFDAMRFVGVAILLTLTAVIAYQLGRQNMIAEAKRDFETFRTQARSECETAILKERSRHLF